MFGDETWDWMDTTKYVHIMHFIKKYVGVICIYDSFQPLRYIT
jgi:hypothetical protein